MSQTKKNRRAYRKARRVAPVARTTREHQARVQEMLLASAAYWAGRAAEETGAGWEQAMGAALACLADAARV